MTLFIEKAPLAKGSSEQALLDHAAKAWCWVAAAIALSLPLSGGDAEAAGRITWSTGALLQRRLAQPVDVLWSGTPLREAIAGLSRAQQVAILIDRRVDPGQKLDLTLKGVPLETTLQTIATQCDLGVSQLGSVVYLGPMAATERLRSAAAAFEKATEQTPKATRRKFSLAKAMSWEDLATPRELLVQLGKQNGLEIVGLERVPHDLWAAADLPPLSLVDRLTLIAFQYDLTFTVLASGTKLELAPIPDSLRPLPEKRKDASQPRSTPKPSPADPSASIERVRIQRMSVQAEPLGPVLRQLAERLGLELKIDEKTIQEAGISLDQPVTAKVENATIDELVRELLKSTGLKFQRRQKVVEIGPDK